MNARKKQSLTMTEYDLRTKLGLAARKEMEVLGQDLRKAVVKFED